MKINELKDKIQKLLSYSTNLAERSKNLSRLLYQQLYEIIELERLESLDGKFLEAYLIWKSITRANYQTELLKHAPQDKEKLLEIIKEEVEMIEINNQKQLLSELTNEELVKQMYLKVAKGEITIEQQPDGAIIIKQNI